VVNFSEKEVKIRGTSKAKLHAWGIPVPLLNNRAAWYREESEGGGHPGKKARGTPIDKDTCNI